MVDILQKGIMLALLIMIPLLGITLVVGVLISIIQAATQIQEMTLTFIPKLFITLLVLLLGGPWILRLLVSYTANVFKSIPSLVK